MNSKGFTLIEVMISMFIMAMLTVLVSQSIRTAVQNKQKLEARIASETALYDALRVIKMDVERAFHYQDVFFEIENLALAQLEKDKQPNPNGPGAGNNQQRQPPVKLTQFLGEANSMHFTALNHFRTKYNAQESDQMEVGYYLDGCDHPSGEGSTQCLWRRSNPQIDDQVDQDGSKVIVTHHVTDFSLEYRNNKETGQYVKQWRSDNKGRADQRNTFPHFVKIKLIIEDKENKKAKKAEQTIVVAIAFPNNESFTQQQQAGQNAAGQGPGGALPQ
ncbi:MAG: type II secretion system protein GspJ [Pseudomonadota bacterium]